MADAFGLNVEQLTACATNLQPEVNNFEQSIESIMNFARSLEANGVWSGTVYNQFIAKLEAYKSQHLDTLIATLKQWPTNIDSMASEGEDLIRKNTGLFQ